MNLNNKEYLTLFLFFLLGYLMNDSMIEGFKIFGINLNPFASNKCVKNCKECDGSGKDDCTLCEDGFVIMDKDGDGAGSCWPMMKKGMDRLETRNILVGGDRNISDEREDRNRNINRNISRGDYPTSGVADINEPPSICANSNNHTRCMMEKAQLPEYKHISNNALRPASDWGLSLEDKQDLITININHSLLNLAKAQRHIHLAQGPPGPAEDREVTEAPALDPENLFQISLI